MHRTTLMLPSELKARAQQRARDLGVSLGELVRRAIESELGRSPARRRTEDPLFADPAVWSGDAPLDGATNHDRYLYGDQEAP